MLSKLILIFLATALTACNFQPPVDSTKLKNNSYEVQRHLLVGKWFGESPTKDGGKRLQITQRLADGTYKVQFRIITRTGEVSEQSEVGVWGSSGLVYFTIMKGWLDNGNFSPADPTDASFNDAYEIIELNQEHFRYKSYATGNDFTLYRVTDSFVFPND